MERSAAIRKIEQDMMELSRLYQEVAELIHQQEPAVEEIGQHAEDVRENMTSANKQIDSAITSARKARKWKWYALIICRKSPVPIAFPVLTDQSSSLPLSSVWPSVSPKHRPKRLTKDPRCLFGYLARCFIRFSFLFRLYYFNIQSDAPSRSFHCISRCSTADITLVIPFPCVWLQKQGYPGFMRGS